MAGCAVRLLDENLRETLTGGKRNLDARAGRDERQLGEPLLGEVTREAIDPRQVAGANRKIRPIAIDRRGEGFQFRGLFAFRNLHILLARHDVRPKTAIQHLDIGVFGEGLDAFEPANGMYTGTGVFIYRVERGRFRYIGMDGREV